VALRGCFTVAPPPWKQSKQFRRAGHAVSRRSKPPCRPAAIGGTACGGRGFRTAGAAAEGGWSSFSSRPLHLMGPSLQTTAATARLSARAAPLQRPFRLFCPRHPQVNFNPAQPPLRRSSPPAVPLRRTYPPRTRQCPSPPPPSFYRPHVAPERPPPPLPQGQGRGRTTPPAISSPPAEAPTCDRSAPVSALTCASAL
jgi:hypothetical protein